MANFNKIVLIGTVSNKPETRFGMENSSSVAHFTLAVDRPARADGSVEKDFIPVVAFGKNADFVAEYIQENSFVVTEGQIQVRTTENDGQREWHTEVIANSVKELKPSTAPATSARQEPTTTATATTPETETAPAPNNESNLNPFANNQVTEDDVPF